MPQNFHSILPAFALLFVALTGVIARSTYETTEFVTPSYEEEPQVAVKLLLDEQTQSRLKSGKFSRHGTALTPLVFWHGMGDTAFGSINMDRLALQKKYPGLVVLSIQIGENSIEDELGGFFVNVNYQVAEACREILNNTLIRSHGSFNAVGFSQGAQFLRALIQRCPFRENGIKVKNYISLGGQHQGVFGLPRCNSNIFCDHIRDLVYSGAYEYIVQEHVVQAEYWHDPYHEDTFRTKSVFLADINNENSINEYYRRNLLSLRNMVLVEFENDDMVIPRESSSFGFFAPNQTDTVIPLEESKLYTEDRLGLRKLYDSNRLHFIKLPGRHLQYNMDWFLKEIASVYLIN